MEGNRYHVEACKFDIAAGTRRWLELSVHTLEVLRMSIRLSFDKNSCAPPDQSSTAFVTYFDKKGP